MLRRNEMIAVLQNLDEYDAVAIINAEGEPSAGLLKRLDCSEPQPFMAVDPEGELMTTPLEVVYDPYTAQDILFWRSDPETPALEGVRLASVAIYSTRTIVAEASWTAFDRKGWSTEDEETVWELVETATGGNDDE